MSQVCRDLRCPGLKCTSEEWVPEHRCLRTGAGVGREMDKGKSKDTENFKLREVGRFPCLALDPDLVCPLVAFSNYSDSINLMTGWACVPNPVLC